MGLGKQEKKVRELVIPLADYPHMPYWASLKEAVVQLTLAQQGRGPEERRRKVLVFDEAYELQGILTQRDILLAAAPGLDGKPPAWEEFLAGLGEQSAQPIKNFMAPLAAMAQADDGLLAVCHLMVGKGVDLVPVMDGGKLLGVARLDDLFSELSRTILAS
jgi:CBS domain-containing protein